MKPSTKRFLMKQLKQHEGTGPTDGERMFPYEDPRGFLTIGWGRNLDENGITKHEAKVLLQNDVERHWDELVEACPWVLELNEVRQAALGNMVYNLGLPTFLEFKNMISALKNNDFESAADEALNSRWADQVGNRADQLAKQLRDGTW